MEVKDMEFCCGHGRRYLTRKEKIEHLEDYKKELEQEVAGVGERIEEQSFALASPNPTLDTE
jgi:hypothetical protein